MYDLSAYRLIDKLIMNHGMIEDGPTYVNAYLYGGGHGLAHAIGSRFGRASTPPAAATSAVEAALPMTNAARVTVSISENYAVTTRRSLSLYKKPNESDDPNSSTS